MLMAGKFSGKVETNATGTSRDESREFHEERLG